MQGATCSPPPGEPPTNMKTENPDTDVKEEVKSEQSDSDYEDGASNQSRKRNHSEAENDRNNKRSARYRCSECGTCFETDRELELHSFTSHSKSNIPDLMQIDFTSRKFSDIARDMFTRSRYCCQKCRLEFPNDELRNLHERNCEKTDIHGDVERREDFFSKLDLRNKFKLNNSLTPPLKSGITDVSGVRDLADIQSILNVTSAGGLLERLARRTEPTTLTPPDSGSRNCYETEEAQDKFAAEFRRMKMRGEFPCRLCPAKFPNLRALKGHNRVHLSGAGPGPYRCNMCPHASLDKAALVRHMRTHNGDRPYECAVCNYAFTTKANCERHLRNRHAKVTREDVKRSIIYHPSEDPNNDEANSRIQLNREETKRTLTFSSPPEHERRDNNSPGRITPLSHFTNVDRRLLVETPPQPILNNILTETPETTPKDEEQRPRIKVKGIGRLTLAPELLLADAAYARREQDDEPCEPDDVDAPVDLSTSDVNDECDALDLSKKRYDSEEPISSPSPIDITKTQMGPAALAAAFEKTQRMLLAQRHLFENGLPKLDPAFYASQLYGSAIPGITLPPTFPLHPYLLRPPFFAPSDLSEVTKERIQKELMRGLNLSGGGVITSPEPPRSPIDITRNNIQNPTPPPASSPSRPPNSDSVKMVIKNGVLMPKQKQRRYRTERPFSCSQCSARFTLRSNMERHVKQQHPAHWSMRGRTNQPPPQTQALTPDLLAERVRFAVLARQLETNSPARSPTPQRRDSDEVADNEEEDEDALVIDEDDASIEGARRAAQEAVIASVRQQELARDLELRITGNLISKPILRQIDEQPQNMRKQIMSNDEEEDEEGLVASTSEGNISGSDENRSESDVNGIAQPEKKKSAYSLAPNRVSCPYCSRKFPWTSSLRRHVLTHTGQKPFKCSHCPLLFTTKSNCDRHLARKHSATKTQNIPPPPVPSTPPSSHTAPEDDAAYKCHLCEASFTTREATLAHLASEHTIEYELLISKGALEASPTRDSESASDDSVRLPDYANRKVICVFCVRRFWSAEDLRRHMRTHSGERPFACDLCSRRFTLKHSMLRHRKKHRTGEETVVTEDESPMQSPQYTGGLNNNNSPPTHKESTGDLIGDLLGISDRRVLNQLLTSADRAAELLGVDQ